MNDRTLTCVECGRAFVWTDGEQRFYRQRGLSAPRRCSDCRSRRADRRDAAVRGRAAGATVAARQSGTRAGRRQQQVLLRPSRQDYLYGGPTLGSAVVVAAVLVWNGLDPLLSWLLAISGVTFLTYGYDKAIAGSRLTRIPEGVLLALTLVGGTGGALLGMRVFHHKTAKTEFKGHLAVVVLSQVALVVVYVIVRVVVLGQQ